MNGSYHQPTVMSRRYRQIAAALARTCPAPLATEIAITGSVAAGIADAASDIEVLAWAPVLPRPAEQWAWLERIGAIDTRFDAEPIEDGSLWVTFRFGNVWVEWGWQTTLAQDQLIEGILAGKVLDHDRLKLASIITHALPLRTTGLLERWCGMLSHYPDVLQQALIQSAVELWTFPHLVAARWTLAQRGDHFALTQRLVWESGNMLRLLFAVNRQWEPEWKWLHTITDALPTKPDRLVERIDAVFTEPSPHTRLTICFQLIRDALALVPAPYDVEQAMATINAGLQSTA